MDDWILEKARKALVKAGATQSDLVRHHKLATLTARKLLGLTPGTVTTDSLSKALAAYGLTIRVIREKSPKSP